MKEHQVCSKCGCNDIIYFDPNKKGHKNMYNMIIIDTLHSARVEKYFCKR